MATPPLRPLEAYTAAPRRLACALGRPSPIHANPSAKRRTPWTVVIEAPNAVVLFPRWPHS